MTQTPQGNNPVQPQTPATNQQVPQSAGNPRFNTGPGLDPSPNPRIVVKAVNPPVTPDQVVAMAEMPSAATLDLPKIQNIKITPVKNKTIQGHLKAIEAKMIATEKLMKDIVKLQKVQIITEKELFERKRELYQNTFEEYLLDKTVDFENPSDPDQQQKLPKKPGGGFNFGGGRRRPPGRPPSPAPVPVPSPSPVDAGEETPDDPAAQPDPPVVSPTPPGIPEREEEPGFQLPNVLDLIKVVPFLFQDLLRNQPLGAAKFEEDFLAGEPGTPSYSPPPTFGEQAYDFLFPEQDPMITTAMDALTVNPPAFGMGGVNPYLAGGQALYNFAAKSPRVARLFGVVPRTARTPSAITARQRLLNDPMRGVIPQAPKFRGVPDAQRIQSARMIQAAGSRGPAGGYTDPMSRGPVNNVFNQSLLQEGLDFSNYKPLTDVVDTSRFYSNMDISDDALRMLFSDSDAAKALNYFDDIPANDLAIRSEFDSFSTPQGQAAMRDALRDSGSILDDITPSDAERAFGTSKANVSPELDGITNITNKASGGMGDVDLYSSEALNYFRGMSNKIMPMAGGGFMGWFNKGVNTRIPVESKAKFGNPFSYFQKNPDPTTLFGDDALQRGQSNKNFKAGKKPGLFGRPDRAFGLDLIDSFKQRRLVTVPASQGGPMSGPTPITRELVKRPIRAMRSNVQHPLMLALDFIINDFLLNPRSTAVYDQVTGPNAYYNDPAYKGPMPSQNLENAQNSMMSGDSDQKFEVKPLPPEYIKIPAKKKAPDFVGTESPDIEMRSSVFTRSSTHID